MEAKQVGKIERVKTLGDPARVALAECILDRDAKARAIEAAREAVARSNDLVADAERHEQAVKIALSSARDGREARLREAIEGGAVIEKAPSTREQRFAELDAADELAAAKSVLTNCTAALGFAATDLQWAQRKVEAATAAVLAGEVERLLSETASLREQLDGKYAVMLWLRDLLPPGDERQKIARALPPPPPPGVLGPDYQAPSAWVEAREALMRDADVRLPT
jgi:hypothetical protein